MVARHTLIKVAAILTGSIALLYAAYLALMLNMGNTYILKPCFFYPSLDSAEAIFETNKAVLEEMANLQIVLTTCECFGQKKGYLVVYFPTKASLKELETRLARYKELRKIPRKLVNV